MAHDKYIVFKREEFLEWLRSLDDSYFSYAGNKMAIEGAEALSLADAVVIRRQDLFASPCLATYASMIALVANNIDDKDKALQLIYIADYFEQQAVLAAAEGFKLPDVD